MNEVNIREAAKKMEKTSDLLTVLNKIKMSELGDKGHPFNMRHLNYLIHPARNKNSYKSFGVPKKSGGERMISAPTAMLKSFLTYTNRLLQAFYEAPSYVTGFTSGKSVVDNAERHIGKNFIFNIDLQDFFPNISKSRVWATLKCSPFKFNDTIADAIAGLCCTEMMIGGETKWVLPQGSPCSPILTNLVCRNLDRRLNKLAKEYKLHYSRYADDITFSGNRNVFQRDGRFYKQLVEIVSGQNFIINEKKTRLQRKCERQEVTGLVLSDRVNVTREYVRGLDNILYIWEKYGEADAYAKFLTHYMPKQNLHKRKPDMQSVIRGKLLYLKMVKGADDEVWRRLQRRFNRLSGAKPSIESANIKYKYTLADFEKKIGCHLRFKIDAKGLLRCRFTLGNGNETEVALSHYVRTRFTNIIEKKDNAQFKKLKKLWQIIFYEDAAGGYWRIERKRHRVEETDYRETNTEATIDMISSVPNCSVENGDAVVSPGRSSDEVLAALVASDFDLNTLDEWDKIKSS